MSLPEYNTTNCETWEEYWDTREDAERYTCPVCDCILPDNAIHYWIGNRLRPICKEHKVFHYTYDFLKKFEQDTVGSEFNALSVCLKLSEEGVI